ncbi:gliding motility lipoprotein GldD [Marinigracilibium pacificum]|uniref:Gliding motility lipoprotein GldD n=1 Tax=Marinigracilibium pacificum TaxID=2729599 RepID=A0A848IXW3_9BACT|nr:gliding motility lipoprotein GldD [Marinigracilibium pacificum]NMM47084.1 gliding motility lipoprotein GldD [Marinigracilibium pacificum]
MKKIFIVTIIVILITSACNNDFVPKPKGYNYIVLPEHQYERIPNEYPYSFNKNTAAVIKRDSSGIAEPYWIHLFYPDLNADIQITYKRINNDSTLLREYIGDAFKLTSKHQVKATGISEVIDTLETGKVAVYALIQGEVPSQVQFFVTDSTENFFRGAMYFPIATKSDSLKPSVNYLKEDINVLLNSLEWREVD